MDATAIHREGFDLPPAEISSEEELDEVDIDGILSDLPPGLRNKNFIKNSQIKAIATVT